VIIEKYTDVHSESVLQLVKSFYDESLKEYNTSFNIESLRKLLETCKQTTFLLIINDRCEGVLGGLEARNPISGDKTYQEFIWYVNPSVRRLGGLFFRKVQSMLKAEGYTAIVMACMANSNADKIFKLYKRMGFVVMETHFIKAL
jgi:hypothetical protein